MNPTKFSNFHIRRAEEADREEILENFRKWFFPQTPLGVSLNLINEENPICEEYEKYTMKAMEKPAMNLLAICEEKMVGVCLNKEVTKENYFEPKLPYVKNEKFALITKFMADVRKEANLFEKFPQVNKAYLIQSLGVSDDFRGRGVGVALALNAVEMAKEMEYKLIAVDCTSYYSAEVFKKIGFEVVCRIYYDDYKLNGEVVWNVAPPHDCVEVLAMKV